MSLAVVFKSAEGIVLAADSRVTLTATSRSAEDREIVPAFYDNATKLLKVNGQNYVAAVTYGLGALGVSEPRTAHSFLPEFEAALTKDKIGRLSVGNFAQRLSDFFMAQWNTVMPSDSENSDMQFLIGGYDENEPYGKIYEIIIPSIPVPTEIYQGAEFGLIYGGQTSYVDRIIQGFDDLLPAQIQDALGLTNEQTQRLFQNIIGSTHLPIPSQFLPLQDCVDLTIFLVRMTIMLQRWAIGNKGVGGHIDAATITRVEGYRTVQQKQITGERELWENMLNTKL